MYTSILEHKLRQLEEAEEQAAFHLCGQMKGDTFVLRNTTVLDPRPAMTLFNEYSYTKP